MPETNHDFDVSYIWKSGLPCLVTIEFSLVCKVVTYYWMKKRSGKFDSWQEASSLYN
jgi:hypothetical protein